MFIIVYYDVGYFNKGLVGVILMYVDWWQIDYEKGIINLFK